MIVRLNWLLGRLLLSRRVVGKQQQIEIGTTTTATTATTIERKGKR